MTRVITNKILEQLNTLILVLNQQGLIEFVSPSFKRLLGYEPEDLLGEGWWNLTRRNNEQRLLNKTEIIDLFDFKREFKPLSFERVLKAADGSEKWILWNVSKNENETLIGIGQDITEKKAIELKLDEKHKEIEQAYRNNKLLSEIGQNIISTLNFETILRKLYDNVNKLMDAECFGVRIYHPNLNAVEYKFEVENNIVAKPVMVPLTDEDNYTVWCIKNKQDIFLGDNKNEYQKYVKQIRVVSGEMPNSLLFTRMLIGEKIVGVITVQSFKKFAYKPHHLDILRTLGAYTAIALENAALYQNLEERVDERTNEIKLAYENTRLLSEISKDISSSLSVEIIISKVYQNIRKLMPADCFGIGIYNPVNEKLEFKGFLENEIRMPEFSFDIKDSNRLATLSFNQKKEIIIDNYELDYSKYIKQLPKAVSGRNTASIIYLPINSKEKTIGVITIQSFLANAYSEYQFNILKNLALSIGISLENAGIYERLEEIVKDRTKEILKQKSIIEEKNKDITDSINYAKRIQAAIMPDEDGLKKFIPESYIYFKPKDIVSGDLYWYHKKGNKIFVAAIDCTGHGVPGAIMSVIANGLIRDSIIKRGIEDPGDILHAIDNELINLLSRENNFSKTTDGMDIALVVVDFSNYAIEFAGAYRPLILLRDQKIIEYKGSRFPIGFYDSGSKSFTTVKVPFKLNDRFYLFTDGFIDQFGGENKKKLNRKRFYDLLLNSNEMKMGEQKSFLDYAINNWKQDESQTDDVLVIGLNIS